MADEIGGAGGYEREEEPDFPTLYEDGLRERLKGLEEVERAVSYRRRVLQGKIDLIRAGLVRRGGAALSPEQLARVLLGGSAGRGRGNPEGAS